jgi:hypothetical protein
MVKKKKLYIPTEIIDTLPSLVKNELKELSTQKQEEFLEEYNRKKKSVGWTYVLWFIGFHYAYLRKWGTLVLYWITFAGLFIWAIIDLFRIPGLVKDYNKDASIDIMRNLKVISE